MRKQILTIFILVSIFVLQLQAQEMQYKIVPDLTEQMRTGLKELTVQTHNGTERALELRQNPADSSWVLICLDESVPYLVKKYQTEHANQKFAIKLVPLQAPKAISPADQKGKASENSVSLKCIVKDIPQTNQDRVMKVDGVKSIRKVVDNLGDSVWVITCASSCDKASLGKALKEKGKETITCRFEEIEQTVIPPKPTVQAKPAPQPVPPTSPNISCQNEGANTASTPSQPGKPAPTPSTGGKYAKTAFLFIEDTTLFKAAKTLNAADIHPAMRSYCEMAKIIQYMSEQLSYIHDYTKTNNIQKINDCLDKISESEEILDAYRDKEMKCLSPAQQTYYKKLYDEFGKLWDKYK